MGFRRLVRRRDRERELLVEAELGAVAALGGVSHLLDGFNFLVEKLDEPSARNHFGPKIEASVPQAAAAKARADNDLGALMRTCHQLLWPTGLGVGPAEDDDLKRSARLAADALGESMAELLYCMVALQRTLTSTTTGWLDAGGAADVADAFDMLTESVLREAADAITGGYALLQGLAAQGIPNAGVERLGGALVVGSLLDGSAASTAGD